MYRRLLYVTQPEALKRLINIDSGIEVRLFKSNGQSFHPKAYLFQSKNDNGTFIVGSSNLSASAFTTGVEWNVVIDKSASIETFDVDLNEFSELFYHDQTVPLNVETIAVYEKEYEIYHQKYPQLVKAGFRACKRCQPEVDHSPNTSFVKSVRTFLEDHYEHKLVLQDVADHIGVSAYYLERLFKKETAETPRLYLEKIRVNQAAYLLKNTDRTNLEICYEVGFQSPSNFYKVFRQLKKCSPTEYRNS